MSIIKDRRIIPLFLVVIFIFILFPLHSVFAQNVNVTINSVEFNGKEYTIKGHVKITDANKGGLPERDTVIIFMDVLQDKNGIYPVMPDTYSIANGGYVANGKLLTDAEVNGTDCKTYSLWKWTAEVNAWQKGAGELNGSFHYDASKVPSTYENDFEIKVSKEFIDKSVRIRAHLEHIIGGPFAAWPGFIFKHQILYQGILKKISGIDVGSNADAKSKAEAAVNSASPESVANSVKDKDAERKKEGMHIFSNQKKPVKNPLAQKYRDRINQIINKHKLSVIKIRKDDSTTKQKVTHDKNNLGFWDKLKYYGSKLIGMGAGKIPGVKYISNKVEDKAVSISGLDNVKKTQLDLGVDKTAADLYNSMSVYPEREKKYATVINIVKTLSSGAANHITSIIDGAGKSVKKKTAIYYEKEYKAAIKAIKQNGGNVEIVEKDIKNDGVIDSEYDPATGAYVSDIVSNGSKGDFKDPVKRFKFYVEVAKKRGDL